MKGLAMNLLRLMIVFLMALPLSACALSGGTVSGQVLEEGTDKPIPDAIVVVLWKGRVSSLADSHGVCVHVDSTVSDSQGRYKFARWSKPSNVGPVFDLEPVVSAYKIGYGLPQTPSQKDEIVYLALFKGGSAERLEYLWRMRPSCDAQDESEKNKLTLLKALYDEAKLHGGDKKPEPNLMSLVERIRYDMEIIELGFEEAERRHLKRP